jgi:hypothetical protein
MSNRSETHIEKRIRELERQIYGGGMQTANPTPATFTYPSGIDAGATLRTLPIPTTNLADAEEIRTWFVAPGDVTSTVAASTLLNDAGNAPDGLDVVIYDFTAGTEVYRDGSRYNEPADLTLTEGNTHYFAIDNSSSATQNASAVLDMEVK